MRDSLKFLNTLKPKRHDCSLSDWSFISGRWVVLLFHIHFALHKVMCPLKGCAHEMTPLNHSNCDTTQICDKNTHIHRADH